MKRIFFIILIICTAFLVLAGCSAASDLTDSDPAIDEDSASEVVSVQSDISLVTPDPVPAIPNQSISELLTENSAFSILFVNVGKADAAILRFGEATVLIDTGTVDSVPQLFAGLNALGVDSIDAVFLTHSHSDHIGGLDALAANYDIQMVYSPCYSEVNDSGVGKIIKRVEKLGLPHTELKAGDVVPITGDVTFSVLGPLMLNEENDNDNSLVLRFSYQSKTFLFAGDMQFAEEQTLINSGESLKSDVLKVGNHGNPDATGANFGALVSPSIAIISTNTDDDTDSAHPLVYAALSMADIQVTQNFPIGVLLTMDVAGNIVLSNPARESELPSVSVSALNVGDQTVTLTNNGSADIDLSGYLLFSVRSGAALRIPAGTTLSAGDSLQIGKGQSLIFPDEEKPLDKKKSNTVQLFSPLGTLVGELAE